MRGASCVSRWLLGLRGYVVCAISVHLNAAFGQQAADVIYLRRLDRASPNFASGLNGRR